MISKLSTKLNNITYIVFQALLMIAFIPRKEYMSSISAAIILILYLLFMLYEHKRGIVITNFIRVSVIVSLLASSLVGDYLHLYKTSIYFDKLLHVFGTFSYAILVLCIARREGFFQGITKFMIYVFTLLLGSFLGTVYEIIEYISDTLFKTHNQSSNADTNIDMMCNILGSAIAGIYVVYINKKETT